MKQLNHYHFDRVRVRVVGVWRKAQILILDPFHLNLKMHVWVLLLLMMMLLLVVLLMTFYELYLNFLMLTEFSLRANIISCL